MLPPLEVPPRLHVVNLWHHEHDKTQRYLHIVRPTPKSQRSLYGFYIAQDQIFRGCYYDRGFIRLAIGLRLVLGLVLQLSIEKNITVEPYALKISFNKCTPTSGKG